MKLKNLRYYTVVILIVLGVALCNTMVAIWLMDKFLRLSQDTIHITAICIYVVLTIVGLIQAIPRFKGVV